MEQTVYFEVSLQNSGSNRKAIATVANKSFDKDQMVIE
jgi:hypothetical protein